AFDLEAGQTLEVAFLLGEAADRDEARALAAQFSDLEAVHAAIEDTKAFWRKTTSAVQIETPEPALDLMVNGWLVYQNLSCRLWGRTAFYQSGGAYGFRDQLQDTSALVYARPDITRAQIVRNAAHQFEEGDVLHWWHPPLSKGIRTRFADDLLWLPLLASQYVATTGDASVLEDDVRFLTAPVLQDGQDEVFLQPRDAGTSASVYEHAARAVDRSLEVGEHGLPLMGVGDWNDGMNRVGRLGRGESVWMGFFLAATIDAFLPHVLSRGDDARAERYRQHRADLEAALNADGWDGAWYRRAFYDDGAVMGSTDSDECQIDALAQAWAVLSGTAPPDRAALALDALETRLVDEDAGLIRLLDPPFDVTPHDPGYIKGYVPGVRENGGQYTHAALWAIRALAEAGRCERAALFLTMLSPVRHGDSREAVATYMTEPYVIAADVYGVAPHVGRGGWTWYTGSAGWMWRVAVESILGFGLEGGDAITLAPCIPADWPGFSIRYRLPDGSGTVYTITVERGSDPSLTLDGAILDLQDARVRIPIMRDGAEHEVVLRI
ncbi:GH36-type glycosyl hydrolase domain-containing protein, partial [Rubrivirga sp.]|uniref:GH36-type glycosyl hydrolase domain-containing protein n=1 Tax=Rubrivirga sp. TaxID=1885344 RepID=UPI003C79342C